MTEDEAKTKWCPFVRRLAVFSVGDQRQAAAPYNRAANEYNLPEARCIASACMAWRWTAIGHQFDRSRKDYEHPHGYCGLAGQP